METIIETKELNYKIYNPQTTHKVVALKNISMSIQQELSALWGNLVQEKRH